MQHKFQGVGLQNSLENLKACLKVKTIFIVTFSVLHPLTKVFSLRLKGTSLMILTNLVGF